MDLLPQKLREELNSRQIKNPSYSLRGFAKSLGLSASYLSEVLAGKRSFSRTRALRVAERMYLNPEEIGSLISSKQAKFTDPPDKALTTDEFHAIADWYHYGILSLADIPDNKPTEDWIAPKLGITKVQAKKAFERLKRLGHIKVDKKHFRQVSPNLMTQPKQTSVAQRRFLSQVLAKANAAIEDEPYEVRCFQTLTKAIDPADIEDARQMLIDFYKQFQNRFADSKKKRVYVLSMQLFPLDKG